jgi:hypothetical protein
MALRTTPPGEDPTMGTRGMPTPFTGPGNTPPGNNATLELRTQGRFADDELENSAQHAATDLGPDHMDPSQIDFLGIVKVAEQQSLLYTAQVNRRAWAQSLRAFHNEHYVGSKYVRPEWRGRSRLFVPKTRTAVRKDMASVAASLFNNIDAINCLPGNEGDPRQRGAAAVMEELVNYRTDRTSGKASFPWFLVSMGARQNAVIEGICITKQSWKQEFRKIKDEMVMADDGNGGQTQAVRAHYALEIDRPDMTLFPPENVVIHPGADWTNPAQTSAYLILKYPMTIEEIQAKQNAPVNPWNPDVTEAELKSAVNQTKQDMEAIRRAREMGLDRYDETQTGTEFQVVWIYECFIKQGGEDWTFYSVGDQIYLTDPKPTREVYPAHFGERPVAYGYGSLEAHRIFPMAPVESWQPLQVETNDLRNLMLDATKQNVMPISKVRRGRRIDMDQVKRRSSGSSIFVDDPDDVTWETPPQIGQAPVEMGRELDLELDDLAGQQNYGSVETNNALGKTLGGLKLAAGAANAVQEFDVRVWIETWATPALAQIVQLEQYYEADPVVLGLCGQRAQLFQKYGINQIDDQLLEEQITVRVSVGLGAGDPQQRLAKFEAAAQITVPLIQQSPEFQSGQKEVNIEAVIEEVFGAAGYKDGGARFFKDNGQPRANPMMDLQTQKLQAEIAQRDRQGKAAMMTGIANLGRVALGKRDLESQVADMLMGHQQDANEMGFQHGHMHNQSHLAAMDHGHRHGMAINEHRRNLANDAHQRAQAAQEAQQQQQQGEQGPQGEQEPQAQGGQEQGGQPNPDALMELLRSGQLQFTRGADGRISGLKMAPQGQPPQS